MQINKALFLSQEINPYLPETTMSVLGRNVPQSLQEKGIEVRTFMPKYGKINERRNQLHEVIRLSGLNIVIDDTDHPLIIKVATLLPSRMQVYFIDNDDYFMHRQSAAGLEIYTSPDDNDERIMFFARGVIERVKKLRWVPSMVHCSGWATALAPLYIRRMYADDPTLRDSKIIYSMFADSVPAPLSANIIAKMKMDGFTDEDIEILGQSAAIDDVALGKLAIKYSDAIIQSVPDVNPELLEYARQSGKPLLEFPAGAAPETSINDPEHLTTYKSFYESL